MPSSSEMEMLSVDDKKAVSNAIVSLCLKDISTLT